MGCHLLLQRTFLTQGLNLHLQHCRQSLYCLSYQGIYSIYNIYVYNIVKITIYNIYTLYIVSTECILFDTKCSRNPVYEVTHSSRIWNIPGGSDSKEPTCNVGDPGLIPGSGRSPGEGNGNPLQYSCLENPMDREAWRATIHGVAKNWTWLSK